MSGTKGAVVAGQCFLGADLGQVRDPSALALVERAEVVGDWDGTAYAYRKEVELRLRYLARLPLGMPYPAIAAAIGRMTRSRRLAGRCQLVVDGTGVGRPVVDMLRTEDLGCGMWPVMVTSGQQESESGGYYHVPKRDLIVGLQLRLQQGGLRIADALKYGPALVRELAEMQVKVTPAGNEQYGAWREGQHDDLVFAVALACWGVEKAYPRPLKGAEAYWLSKEPWKWRR